MRLAIIGGTACAAVIVVLVGVPSQASPSCMTQAEARAKFATSHLYWHGAGHCWDATAPAQRLVHRIRPKVDRDVQEPEQEPSKTDSKWRNAMSEMAPGDASAAAAVPALRAPPQALPEVLPQASWSYDQSEAPTPAASLRDRWVDIAQVVPADVLSPKAELAEASAGAIQKFEPLVTPVRVVLIFLGLVLTIIVIELLFRTRIREGGKQ
jgi:hypothetical protein